MTCVATSFTNIAVEVEEMWAQLLVAETAVDEAAGITHQEGRVPRICSPCLVANGANVQQLRQTITVLFSTYDPTLEGLILLEQPTRKEPARCWRSFARPTRFAHQSSESKTAPKTSSNPSRVCHPTPSLRPTANKSIKSTNVLRS